MNDQFHFIGIGGIGMSGLAKMLIAKNKSVSGSDAKSNHLTQQLQDLGATIHHQQSAHNVSSKEMTIIYSTAIKNDNPELAQAKKLGCRLWHRSDLLAYLMNDNRSIAVTGTHGKTTTSALLSHVLQYAQSNPSFVVGGVLSSTDSNSEIGGGQFFVAEADESDRSFIKYFPHYAIITNIEEDHLEHYQDLDDIIQSFQQFINQVSELSVWCFDCPQLRKLNVKGLSYGYQHGADLVIENAKQQGFCCSFDLIMGKDRYEGIKIPMIGEHNILNAAAVFGLTLKLGLQPKLIRGGLASFQGVKRRAEKIGESSKIMIYDDYAHHPTEVQFLIKSMRKAFPKRRIVALFQPHRFSRVKNFKDSFRQSFKGADLVWLTDVFSAGETLDFDYKPQEFAQEIEDYSTVECQYVPKDQLNSYFERHIKPYDICLTIGAGDITQFAYKAYDLLKKSPKKLKLGLICGGISKEHYVSLISSLFTLKNYDSSLMDLTVLKIQPNGQWHLCGPDLKTKQELDYPSLTNLLLGLDIVLPIAHGTSVEDGRLQGFLHTLGVPYCGPHYSQSSLNMNKFWMKSTLKELGIPTVKGFAVRKLDYEENSKAILEKARQLCSFPIVVKPASLGSTIGVKFTENEEQLSLALEQTFLLDSEVIVEPRVRGRELEVSCLETESGLIVSYPGEVLSNLRNYDYEAKYSRSPIEKIVKADVKDPIVKQAQSWARKVFRGMGLQGYARLDFYLVGEELILGEVNTMPGMTPRSLFQRTLIDYGIKPSEIIEQMVLSGLHAFRHERVKQKGTQRFLKEIRDVTHPA